MGETAGKGSIAVVVTTTRLDLYSIVNIFVLFLYSLERYLVTVKNLVHEISGSRFYFRSSHTNVLKTYIYLSLVASRPYIVKLRPQGVCYIFCVFNSNLVCKKNLGSNLIILWFNVNCVGTLIYFIVPFWFFSFSLSFISSWFILLILLCLCLYPPSLIQQPN